MSKYVGNAIGLSMFSQNKANIQIEKIQKEQFCEEINDNNLVNSIGHEGTNYIVNSLCGTKFNTNRIMIKLNEGDILLAISLNTRLQEGQILNEEQMQKMLKEGKIVFYKITVL